MKDSKQKIELDALTSYSMRGLVNQVNENNNTEGNEKILREDIVGVVKENDLFFLLYFK